jgi:hypothetical protein
MSAGRMGREIGGQTDWQKKKIEKKDAQKATTTDMREAEWWDRKVHSGGIHDTRRPLQTILSLFTISTCFRLEFLKLQLDGLFEPLLFLLQPARCCCGCFFLPLILYDCESTPAPPFQFRAPLPTRLSSALFRCAIPLLCLLLS